MGKIDHFAEGESWTGSADLARMMPVLAPFLSFCEGGRSDVLWRVHDRKGEAEFVARWRFKPAAPGHARD